MPIINKNYSQASTTIAFKTVVPSLLAFSTSLQAEATIEAMVVYEKDIPITSDIWLPNIYRLLMRRYRNWEIANENTDDFLDLLWERIEIHVPNYYERKSRYDQFLKMSDRELMTMNKIISNYVDHTDDIVPDALAKELPNVSNQTATQAYGDNSSRLRSQIHGANLALLDDFLSKFSKLFLRISTQENVYSN